MNPFFKLKAFFFRSKMKRFEKGKITAIEVIEHTDIKDKNEIIERIKIMEDMVITSLAVPEEYLNRPIRSPKKKDKYIIDEQCNTLVSKNIDLGNREFFKEWESGVITEAEFLRKTQMNMSVVEILYKRMGRIEEFYAARGQRIQRPD